MQHDPRLHVDYIRQSLSQDKRPLGILIGAGCPCAVIDPSTAAPPLLPDIDALTKIVVEKISCDAGTKLPCEAICAQFTSPAPNIEDLLTRIRSLRAVADGDEARGIKASDLELLDTSISNVIADVMSKPLPDARTPYHQLAAWSGSIRRINPVEFFTPNYDLLLEQALEAVRVPYFDGFAGSHKAFFDPYAMEEDALPPRWARVWKLHGSINWRQSASGAVCRDGSSASSERRVIHPSHLKYEESRKMPYLAMMDRLRAFFKRSACVLVACGYSFRDEHINEIIMQGLQGNATAIVFGLQFGNLEKYCGAIACARRRSNLSILAKNEAVIGSRQARWTEVSAAESHSDSPGVTWVSGMAEDGTTPVNQSQFILGDFASFGQFLEELTGKMQAIRHDE